MNPYVYLVDVIDKIADDWPADRVDLLVRRMRLDAQQIQRCRPADRQLVVHQALGRSTSATQGKQFSRR